MRKRSWLGVVVVVAGIATLGIAAAALASGGARRGRGNVGITVHGGWTILVRRHGKVVARRRFENSYYGQQTLNQILAGKATMGYMRIVVGHDDTSTLTIDGPCHEDALPQFRIPAGPTGCVIATADDPIQGTNVSKTLTLSTGYTSSSLDALTLSGSATAQENGSIDIVMTTGYLCSLSGQTVDCSTRGSTDNYFANVFTQKKLATPIPVQAGEQIEAKVVISFS